jgi:hypothetical protein
MRQTHGGTSPSSLSCCAAASYLGGKTKGHIMFNLFKSLVSAAHVPTDAERERAYLNASVSRFDLERREREIDSGLFRHPHPYV